MWIFYVEEYGQKHCYSNQVAEVKKILQSREIKRLYHSVMYVTEAIFKNLHCESYRQTPTKVQGQVQVQVGKFGSAPTTKRTQVHYKLSRVR